MVNLAQRKTVYEVIRNAGRVPLSQTKQEMKQLKAELPTEEYVRQYLESREKLREIYFSK